MDRLILLLGLVLVQPAGADWKNSLKEGWSSTVEATKEGWDSTVDATTDRVKGLVSQSVEEKIDIPRERALELWDEVQELFEEITALKLEKGEAPERSLFGSTKEDYDEKITHILRDVSILMNDPEIEEERQTLEQLKVKIRQSEERASALRAKAVLAAGKERATLIERAAEHESEVEAYGESRRVLIRQVRERLSGYGLALNREQVEVLLSRVDVDDIVGMTTAFSVIAELTQQFSAATIASGENLAVARKYYGMHVILLELQIYIQKKYIEKLGGVYITKVDQLRDTNEALIDQTVALIMDSAGSYRQIYTNNLKTQKHTLKVLDLYRKILQKDMQKINLALQKVQQNYRVSLNTYQTVTVSADLALLMEKSRNLFNEVVFIQVSELVPFENLQIQWEFELLTTQLRE